jgi:hypothetical protein
MSQSLEGSLALSSSQNTVPQIKSRILGRLGNLEACRRFSKGTARFFFYSNEHRPIHVHVRYGGGEAVFDVEQRVELRESQLKVRELAKAEELAAEHRELSFRSGMSILTDNAFGRFPRRSDHYHDGERPESFPVVRNPRLAHGTAEQLSRIEISPCGFIGLNWTRTFISRLAGR